MAAYQIVPEGYMPGLSNAKPAFGIVRRPRRIVVRIASLALAVGASLLAPRAEATIVTGTFTGVMNAGTDTYGYFGTAGFNVLGQAITGTFQYDTSTFVNQGCFGVEGCWQGPGVTISETISGEPSTYTFYGAASPLAGGLDQYGNLSNAPGHTDVFTLASDDGSVGAGNQRDTSIQLQSTLNDFVTDPSNPVAAFSLSGGDISPSSNGNINFCCTNSEYLSFSLTTAQTTSDIPEPASLMIFGIALAGTAALRRRSVHSRA